MFLEDLGISSSGLDKLIAASYRILGLISYLTAGETETRAWTITNGTKAPGAAGKIHSDFERGFIKAEVGKAMVARGEAPKRTKDDSPLMGREPAPRDVAVISTA